MPAERRRASPLGSGHHTNDNSKIKDISLIRRLVCTKAQPHTFSTCCPTGSQLCLFPAEIQTSARTFRAGFLLSKRKKALSASHGSYEEARRKTAKSVAKRPALGQRSASSIITILLLDSTNAVTQQEPLHERETRTPKSYKRNRAGV